MYPGLHESHVYMKYMNFMYACIYTCIGCSGWPPGFTGAVHWSTLGDAGTRAGWAPDITLAAHRGVPTC